MGMLRLDCGRSKDHDAGIRPALGGLRLDGLDHLANQLGDFLCWQMSPAGERLESHGLRVGELTGADRLAADAGLVFFGPVKPSPLGGLPALRRGCLPNREGVERF
jgi:hypothetical protein